MKEINFYQTPDGTKPVEDFILTLDKKQRTKVLWVLNLIEELDIIPSIYLKKLVNTDDIWEVRVSYAGNIFRLLGFFEDNNLIILNHGFQKKTQKTPAQDIALAESRKKDYLKRKENE